MPALPRSSRNRSFAPIAPSMVTASENSSSLSVHALEFLLKDQCQLTIWDRHTKQGFTPVDLETACHKAELILFCLPVNPHRQILQTITPWLKPDSVCLSIAKGLDEDGKTAAQIFEQELKDPARYCLLYGPMISEEIRSNHYAFAQLGCCNNELYLLIKHLFASTNLYLTETRDINGISWSVILKNVYAILFGMADELQLGDNMRGFLAVAALHELDQIVRFMGGEAGSPFHLAGLGDLITTATSDDSHHHQLGRKLARGETENIVGEGVHTLAMVKKYGLINNLNVPMFELVSSIVIKPQQVPQQIHHYLEQCFG
ncbi:MAG: hypothetical protein OQL09_02730 [Gammaproteobacteria bacterium]|nr:hypothetical protein [Gammaproteobacteria bacterium]